MFTEPIAGEKFFGRTEILDLLDKRVLALRDGYRQNVALTGPNLAGKSSIIHHFLYSIQSEDFIPVYVEVIREPFRLFADKFIATMLYNALRKKDERCGIAIESLLERSATLFPKTCQAISRLRSMMDKQDNEEAYSALLALTSVLKAESSIPCIVLFDEFDNLESLGIKNPFAAFGRIIMVQKDTMYIVSSSRDEAIKKILSEKLSLLFGNFELVKVTNFDMAASSAYLDANLSGLDLDDNVRKFLISFTGGNPFYLDKISRRMRRICLEHMSNHIDDSAAGQAIVELVYNSDGVIHQYLVNYLFELIETKARDNSMAILSSIAFGFRKQQEITRNSRVKMTEAQKILPRLVSCGIIGKNGSCYNIEDPMLEFWLRHVNAMRKSLLVNGAFNKTNLFAGDISSHIETFGSECRKGALARLAELFNMFAGELIMVEGRNIRLPHFSKVEIRAGVGGENFIFATFGSNCWLVGPHEKCVNENDIINFIRNTKSLGQKVTTKVIVPLKGMEDNSKLLAKELKISIWEQATVNNLLALYGKKAIISL